MGTASTTSAIPLTYKDICEVFEQMQKYAPPHKHQNTLIGRAIPEIVALETQRFDSFYSHLIQDVRIPIDSSYMAKTNIQFRFPKSKRKRIRNKWAKNPKNYKIVSEKKYHRCAIMQPI